MQAERTAIPLCLSREPLPASRSRQERCRRRHPYLHRGRPPPRKSCRESPCRARFYRRQRTCKGMRYGCARDLPCLRRKDGRGFADAALKYLSEGEPRACGAHRAKRRARPLGICDGARDAL